MQNAQRSEFQYQEIDHFNVGSVSGKLEKNNSSKARLLKQLANLNTIWNSLVDEFSDSLHENVKSHISSEFDRISNFDDWEVDDELIGKDSMLTFLNLLKILNPLIPPDIGYDVDGYAIMYWKWGEDQVGFTCWPNDIVEWHFYCRNENVIGLRGKDSIADAANKLKEHSILYKRLFLAC